MSQVRDVALSTVQLTMSSRETAELCEKRHDHVMRDIRNMLDEIDLDMPSNLGQSTKMHMEERHRASIPQKP